MGITLTDGVSTVDISEAEVRKIRVPRIAVLSSPARPGDIIHTFGSEGFKFSVRGVWVTAGGARSDARNTVETWEKNNTFVKYDDGIYKGWFNIRNFTHHLIPGIPGTDIAIQYEMELAEAIRIYLDDQANAQTGVPVTVGLVTPGALNFSEQVHTWVGQGSTIFWVAPLLSSSATVQRLSLWASSNGNEWFARSNISMLPTHGTCMSVLPGSSIGVAWNEGNVLKYREAGITDTMTVTWQSEVTIASGGTNETHFHPYLYVGSTGRRFISCNSAAGSFAFYDSADGATWAFRASYQPTFFNPNVPGQDSNLFDPKRYAVMWTAHIASEGRGYDWWYDINWGQGSAVEGEKAKSFERKPFSNSMWGFGADTNGDGLPDDTGTLSASAYLGSFVGRLSSSAGPPVVSNGERLRWSNVPNSGARPVTSFFVKPQSAGVGIGVRVNPGGSETNKHYFPSPGVWTQIDFSDIVPINSSTNMDFYTIVAGQYELDLDYGSYTTQFQLSERWVKRIVANIPSVGNYISNGFEGSTETDYSTASPRVVFLSENPGPPMPGSFPTKDGMSAVAFDSFHIKGTIAPSSGGAASETSFGRVFFLTNDSVLRHSRIGDGWTVPDISGNATRVSGQDQQVILETLDSARYITAGVISSNKTFPYFNVRGNQIKKGVFTPPSTSSGLGSVGANLATPVSLATPYYVVAPTDMFLTWIEGA